MIQTSYNLAVTHFLGFVSYKILLLTIESKLVDFSKYLKNYSIDVSLANTSLDSEEKQVIIAKSKNHIINFYD